MRKIESAVEIERRKSRNVKILGIFILLILTLSTIGYSFISAPGKEQSSVEGEGKLQKVGNKWVAFYSGQNFVFSTDPSLAAEVPVNIYYTLVNYAGAPAYIISENDIITAEIASTLGRLVQVQKACLGSCEEDLPEKTCEQNLIVWKDSLENKVYQNQSCIFIEGDMRAVDAFLYNIFNFK